MCVVLELSSFSALHTLAAGSLSVAPWLLVVGDRDNKPHARTLVRMYGYEAPSKGETSDEGTLVCHLFFGDY